ncbi:hypothetical protein JX265_000913 [Neoarthrinium moseri]|uniref:Mitotic-spindle organizing protein 1 n=1 Tax=Neoarthrinium moseri TaxID=1658444 RepID=A0A9P9WX31_9PEZI|nr:uncharacterized protein JN550_013895 [Neoarthrinium moseri]KAI1845987.1 hypothetical protein JX266_007796 [Neoarthrinium moseri]KAI1856184.1 hypothetical protein JN550_013895 [Neoarthrinium moseri]KAI1880673.1 hypothetical protein JX265_000913 [Neoarthrinium moseri]
MAPPPTHSHSPSTSAPVPATADNAAITKQQAASQAVQILLEISALLNCRLDKQTMSIAISLIEQDVNPENLAKWIAANSRD